MAREFKVGKQYILGGKLYIKEHVCLFRIEGDYKTYYFDHDNPPKYYRRDFATTEEQIMWKLLDLPPAAGDARENDGTAAARKD